MLIIVSIHNSFKLIFISTKKKLQLDSFIFNSLIIKYSSKTLVFLELLIGFFKKIVEIN